MEESDMITSKDIIEKTGISRATLNNYIKLGILPRPIVGAPRPDQHGVKQIGYFPSEALEHIFKVKLLKSQGMTMEEISALFAKERGGSESDLEQYVEGVGRVAGKGIFNERKSSRTIDNGLQVTICDITSPAYLVNRNFEVEWINKEAEDLIFNRRIRSLVDVESRNIFKLFIEQHADGSFVESWKELTVLHFTVLHKFLDEGMVSNLFKGITERESALLVDLFRKRKPANNDSHFHLPVTVSRAGFPEKTYWVHTMTFREGTFIVFVPDDGINAELLEMLKHREKIINELLKRRMPSLLSLCVLIAGLQDAVRISAELLPSQYFELFNGLWEMVGPTFEKHNGVYGKHVGDGMLYYFIDKPGENYIINCINCSIELREIMHKFSNKWKGIKGWNNDLFLNTGINEGQEFFGTIHSANTIEFTALGDTINIASRLSEFAHNGEIWTTKNLISKLKYEERSMFRFGIQQGEVQGDAFIRDSFSRVSDLISPDSSHFHSLSAIGGLPVTEIKEKITPLIDKVY